MKKVLLINPPVSIYVNKTAFIPLPLLVLGTCLKKIREEGFDLSYEVVDLDLMLKQGFFSMTIAIFTSNQAILSLKKSLTFCFLPFTVSII